MGDGNRLIAAQVHRGIERIRNQSLRRIVSGPMQPHLGRSIVLAFVLASLLAACGGSAGPSPGPTIIPAPSPGATLNAGELRLLLIEDLGPRWYCDPDEYPIAHGTEQERAIERYAEMVAEGDIFRAVAEKLKIDPAAAHTDAQKLALYHLWKVALSVPLDPVGDGRYRFDYLSQPVNGGAEGTGTAGIIGTDGQITIEQRAPAGEPMCPICLARGTRIDTPTGQVAIEDLRLGDAIWTLDGNGRRVAGTVIALGSTTAPSNHRVIHLVLADGRSVTASPGHRLADGRTLGSLAVGDDVDGSRVMEASSLPYGGGETFDLVASGATGAYYADGIALGSTLLP